MRSSIEVQVGLNEPQTYHIKVLTKEQVELLEFVSFHGLRDLSASLKMIHNIALYHSDIPFNETEKFALYNLKLLWEGFDHLERMV